MLNVKVQLDVKMDPAIDDRRSLIGPLGSYLPHFSQWPRFMLKTLVQAHHPVKQQVRQVADGLFPY
jgi:hypothetical protein